ncbi:hypothetical protein H2O73_10610 [Vibrio sp. 404]|uniref:Glycosyltransferase n=1 Tax=Vibrio marinisediminis TaxID=2758441 RepID=A0A7W2FRA9_9VIBR|nr:hypothetical protein [Vibrio marinisediminis]MBA5762796.1 hypothetical protein [Vibrio marinisediminis]
MAIKLYYVTRSFYPYQKGGGPIMRTGAVRYLKELGWDITVVMPNYNGDELICENGIWKIPFSDKYHPRLAAFFQRIGFYEDYLDKWVDSAFDYLKEVVNPRDFVFSTCGGELGPIKLGSLLKAELGCRYVVNFRDPLEFGYMNGLRKNKVIHVSREKSQRKYISNADLVITSSDYYSSALKSRFPEIASRVHSNYFGYINTVELYKLKKKTSVKLRIAYSGTMSEAQRPEILYEAVKQLGSDNIEIYFIGNRDNYPPLRGIVDENIHFLKFMPHDEFLKFMCKNIDVGFVSLTNDYYGACVPSKIYEYINLGLPILGVLPEGDGKDIINTFNYGQVVGCDDVDKLVEILSQWSDKRKIERIRDSILKDRNSWAMKTKIDEVDMLLRLIC